MPPEGHIEIEFPSLAGSGDTNPPSGRADPLDSDTQDDEEAGGDDFAWLAAAFADDDLDAEFDVVAESPDADPFNPDEAETGVDDQDSDPLHVHEAIAQVSATIGAAAPPTSDLLDEADHPEEADYQDEADGPEEADDADGAAGLADAPRPATLPGLPIGSVPALTKSLIDSASEDDPQPAALVDQVPDIPAQPRDFADGMPASTRRAASSRTEPASAIPQRGGPQDLPEAHAAAQAAEVKPGVEEAPGLPVGAYSLQHPDEMDADPVDADAVDADGPDSDRPDSDRPDSDRPDSDRPDSDRPDSDRPDSDRPDSGGPGADGEGGIPESSEEAAANAKSEHIDALRRRPGFREELLSAFSQIYRR